MNFDVLPAEGKVCNDVFAYPVRVYYEDTDAGGIVYYANYLKFAERARSEFLRLIGVDQQRDLSENQSGFVVRSCNIEYLSSAVLNDNLVITCKIMELGAASAIIAQEIYSGDELLCTVEVKVVYLNISTHRPTRISKENIEKMQKFFN